MAWTSWITPDRARRPLLRLALALALRPAGAREDHLEVGLLREIPGPDRVLLVVPADLRDYTGGQLVLMGLVEADALVVDDELVRAHVGLLRRPVERRGVDRLRAVDRVGHPQHPGHLAHRELAHVLAAAVLLVDLVDLLPRGLLAREIDCRRVAAEPAHRAVRRLLRVEPGLVGGGAIAGRDHLRHEARALGVGLE